MQNWLRLLSLIVLLPMGLGCCGCGILVTILGPFVNSQAERVARLEPSSAVSIDDGQVGREVLIEGLISSNNPVRERDFVLYVREEYRGIDNSGTLRWVEDARVTPPLLVELADGRVRIGNSDYGLELPPATYQDPGELVWDAGSEEGSHRYEGFRAGDPVLAIGTLQQGSEGLELHAQFLYGGSRQEYIDNNRGFAAYAYGLGASVAVGGFGLMVLAGLILRRSRRTPEVGPAQVTPDPPAE